MAGRAKKRQFPTAYKLKAIKRVERGEGVLPVARELGIPAALAPGIDMTWYKRGQNAVAARRAELRLAAKARIAALEAEARTRIELHCLDAQTRLLAQGLSSAAAIAFFDALPPVEELMPSFELTTIEGLLRDRLEHQGHHDAAAPLRLRLRRPS